MHERIVIDSMQISDAAQARALASQGFISEEELEKALKSLGTEQPYLAKLAALQSRNLSRSLRQTIADAIKQLTRK